MECAACHQANPDGAKFCNECGSPLAGPGGQEVRKTLTILFADLVGFTALGERLDQESLRRVMDRFYDEMRGAVHAHGGTVAKFIGDAVMAIWGMPVVREDDALRAVRAAEDMRAKLATLNEDLQARWGVRVGMRTGVNTGEVVVDPTKPADLLVGDTLNVAARLEQAAADGEILAGPETYRLVRDHATLEAGRAAPAQGEGAAAERVPARRRPPPRSPLPRAPAGAARRARRRAGPARAGVRARRARAVRPGSSPSSARPAWGRRAWRASSRPGSTGGRGCCAGTANPPRRGRRSSRWWRCSARRSPSAPPSMPTAASREAVAALLGDGATVSAEETFWAVRRFLEALARERRCSSCSTTCTGASRRSSTSSSTSPSGAATARCSSSRSLAPSCVRPGRPWPRPGRWRTTPSRSSRSRPRRAGPWSTACSAPPTCPGPLAERVLETADGNPLFLGEMLRMLVDDGVLRRDGGTWTVAEAEGVSVPPTIQALLAARLERLPDGERRVAQYAAVVGPQFSRDAVAMLTGGGRDRRAPRVAAPQGAHRAACIDGPHFRFAHALIRDAAYRPLLKEARAELHERFAGWLEGRGDEQDEIVGFHLERAYGYRRELGSLDDAARALGARAAERLREAGRRALAREDLPAATNLLTRALDVLEPDDRAARRGAGRSRRVDPVGGRHRAGRRGR